MGNYIVYKHTNKINKKCYIGITSQTPNKRWGNGEGYKPKSPTNGAYFYNAIKKYGWDNFTHEILFTGLTHDEANQKEIELIQQYKSNQRKYGYNLDKGGNGSNRISEETRQRLIDVHKDKAANAERYKKISESRKGMTFSDEHKKNLSKSKIGKYDGGLNPNARAVNQYTLAGEFIRKWDCLTDANREIGVEKANICRAIKNNLTAGGFRWQYADMIIS